MQIFLMHNEKYLGHAYDFETPKVYKIKGYRKSEKIGANFFYELKKDDYLPDTRRIQGIFVEEEDANHWVTKNEGEYDNYEVSEYELDALLGADE